MAKKKLTEPVAPTHELFGVLRQYNPWWSGAAIPELPTWTRAAYSELFQWVSSPPAPRAVLLSGARQVGKTTLLLQAIRDLLQQGVRPEQILYVTFDHPLMKLIGLEGALDVWSKIQPVPGEVQFLFLDEIQYTSNWTTWLKHQADFNRRRRIAVTGSAIPLATEESESGVGRWHTIKLPTLSFYEYLQIKRIEPPPIPEVGSLVDLFEWSSAQFIQVGSAAKPLIAHFHEYLLRGGFPQPAQVESIPVAQKLLREDIVDKVLKRDMTALFGVRRVLELEKTFLYLCLHDGGILDVSALCSNLELTKPTVNGFLTLLESAHLIYRLSPFGYGKEVLRGKPKVYLADAAIAGSVLLRGRALLEDSTRLGAAVETAFFKHVFSRYYRASIGFSYWKGKGDVEVDLIGEIQGRLVPFEVKYVQSESTPSELRGLTQFCGERKVEKAYLITREMEQFGVSSLPGSAKHAPAGTKLLRVPAPLACYWLSQSELRHAALRP
jgi:uncharacterized protein